MPVLFAYLRPLRSFFAVGAYRGLAWPPVVLQWSKLSCCCSFSIEVCRKFSPRPFGVYLDFVIAGCTMPWDFIKRTVQDLHSAILVGFCLWKISSLLLSWLVSASFGFNGSISSWRFELSSLDAAMWEELSAACGTQRCHLSPWRVVF